MLPSVSRINATRSADRAGSMGPMSGAAGVVSSALTASRTTRCCSSRSSQVILRSKESGAGGGAGAATGGLTGSDLHAPAQLTSAAERTAAPTGRRVRAGHATELMQLFYHEERLYILPRQLGFSLSG